MTPEQFKTLVDAYLDGALSPFQKAELEEAIRRSPAQRAEFWKQTQLHERLRSVAENEALWKEDESFSVGEIVYNRSRRGSWLRNPMVTAAAGFVLSVICTSTVWAYAGQWVSKVRHLPIINGGFEAHTDIGVSVPKKVGVWSGDVSRVTGPENGVAPFSGEAMLRFVRADNDLSEPGARHNVGEVLQIIDLRPWQAELARGNAQIELSARFSSGSQEPGYYFSLRAISFRGPIDSAAEAWRDRAECGRTAAERRVEAQRPSPLARWQKIQLLLPILPETDFLIIQGAATLLPLPEKGTVEFPAHYMDDVTAKLRVNIAGGDL